MTGRVIAGRYNLQHPIGRGAMGVVWRARDQILDRDVAVKEVVISSLIGEEERRNAYQRTLREARTAARLSHRGLVAVYDVAEEDGRPWIVMELVPSRSLDQVLTVEGRLPSLRVARIGQQLLSALAAAHIAGVLHRDVKPSNVLIATDRTGTGWDERAVLTDFGIAQFEGDPRLTQTGMLMGSPGFTAPERIRGGDATPASDLWSLGATLFAAVEGRGPYEQRGGAITTMSAIINEDAPVAAHAGRLAPVIGSLLRRDPSTRPTAPAAARMFAYVLPLLSAAETESPSPAHPPTAASQARPSARAAAPAPVRRPADAPAKPEPVRELAAAATPAAIAAPAPAVAATTPEDRAPAMARAAARPPAKAQAPTAPAAAPSPPSASADAAEAAPEPADTAAPDPVTEQESSTEPAPGAKPQTGKPEAGKPQGANPQQAKGQEAAPPAAASAVEAADNMEAADPEPKASPAKDATPTPTPPAGAAEDAVSEADAATEAPAGADLDADLVAEPDDEAVSVDAVSAVEAPQAPAGAEEDGAEEDGAEEAEVQAADAAVVTAADGAQTIAAGRPGPDDSVIDPPVRSAQPSKPKPAPTFTAARPGERPPTPTFSAARPDQPGTAKRTQQAARAAAPSSAAQPAAAPSSPASYWPAPQAAAPQAAVSQAAVSQAAAPGGQWSAAPAAPGGQYAGPSQPYTDLAAQYPPAPVGGSGRRRGSRFWIIVAICAVLVAAAIGAGTALALQGGNGSASGPGTTVVKAQPPVTAFGSVNALNNPSTVVPAGWTTETVTPATYGTTAGFTIDVPPGWTKKPDGLATYFYGADNLVLDVDLSPHTYPDNMVQEAEHLQQQEAVVDGTFPGYQRLQLQAAPVRGTHGAFWQFTWNLKDLRVRTDDILFVLPTSAGQQSYAVYLRGPDDGWTSTYLPLFEKILPTFAPVTTS